MYNYFRIEKIYLSLSGNIFNKHKTYQTLEKINL